MMKGLMLKNPPFSSVLLQEREKGGLRVIYPFVWIMRFGLFDNDFLYATVIHPDYVDAFMRSIALASA